MNKASYIIAILSGIVLATMITLSYARAAGDEPYDMSAASVSTEKLSDEETKKEETQHHKVVLNFTKEADEDTEGKAEETGELQPAPETIPEASPKPTETPLPTPEVTKEPTPEPTPEPVLTGIDYYRSIEDISGRFIIPDIGLDVGLYNASGYDRSGSQPITDAYDSAAYLYDFLGRILIADHCYQEFGNLYSARAGMHAWIYGQEYVVTEATWGTNEGYGLVINGTDLRNVYDGQITAYTCASTSDTYNVFCVTMAPV